MKKSALILVDLQNDFCQGGSLAVSDGDAVIPIANQLQQQFEYVIATQDWHPADHTSFASNHLGKKIGDVIQLGNIQQILWPDHCVQGTQGAEFHPKLDTTKIQKIIYKGTDKNIDSYSAFFDNGHLKQTELADYCHQQQITDLYIMGLATDYCVKFSCLDAVKLGFHTHVILSGCRGVELNPGDCDLAIAEMKSAGIHIVSV